jgi:hypothetical protein
LLGVLSNGSCHGFIILVFIFELCSTWSHASISCLEKDFFLFLLKHDNKPNLIIYWHPQSQVH